MKERKKDGVKLIYGLKNVNSYIRYNLNSYIYMCVCVCNCDYSNCTIRMYELYTNIYIQREAQYGAIFLT